MTVLTARAVARLADWSNSVISSRTTLLLSEPLSLFVSWPFFEGFAMLVATVYRIFACNLRRQGEPSCTSRKGGCAGGHRCDLLRFLQKACHTRPHSSS